jgi:uncharacterized OB-fold protein
MTVEYNRRMMQYWFDPVAESFEEPYWDAIKRKKLMFQRCEACGRWSHPPRVMCDKCNSSDMEWVESSGKGKIYSYVIFTRETHPTYKVPYEVVLVEMENEEGVRIISNMADCKPDEVYIGMPVEVVFMDVTDEWPLPFFKKAE